MNKLVKEWGVKMVQAINLAKIEGEEEMASNSIRENEEDVNGLRE